VLNLELASKVQEVEERLVELAKLEQEIKLRHIIVFKAKRLPIAIGPGILVKVNTNIGISSPEHLETELRKLHALSTIGYAPDSMMDHTIIKLPRKQFYEYMIEEFDGPIGTLPHYLAFDPDKGIAKEELLDIATAQAEAGVSFMTLHPTPTQELYEKACRMRTTPTTSRGGGIVVSDMYINSRRTNIVDSCFQDLLSILSRHNMALSIGSTFRPATVVEALDDIHRREIVLQGEYVRAAQEANIPVQLEGIGHIRLDQIYDYYELVASYEVPMMPLGPLPTDAAVGQDHIANAIGATHAAWINAAHIINSITREEHTGGIPTEASVLEGLKAARIAAHAVNISRFPKIATINREVSDLRAKSHRCVVEGGLFTRSAKTQFSLGCKRCGPECPLLINKLLQDQLLKGEKHA